MSHASRRRQTRVLILGGGIAGATAAERLARSGVQVHLVEKEAALGGHARQMGCKATETCLRCNVCVADEVLRSAGNAPRVRAHTSTELRQLRPGRNGTRFEATLRPGANGAGKPFTVGVDAVVVATGFEPYNPLENSACGYGRLANVITGIEAERQLAERNVITRPSDGQVPKRVAFIQCVGSRTEEAFRRPEDTDYCSAVCCAYALRMGRRLRHQAGESEITVFYMDIQNFGKGFDAFYAQCRDRMRFVRSRPHELRAGTNGAVIVTYTAAEAGAGRPVCEEPFDLVVLAVGIRPPADAGALAARLGVPLDEYGFFGLKNATAFPDLQREGIYAIGACESPKDIAACIAQAEAVSAAVLSACGAPAPRSAATHLLNAPLDGMRPAGLKTVRRPVRADVVVAGGGVAGLQAALALADLGHPVTLVHAGGQLGGTASSAPELFAHLGPTAGEAAARLRQSLAGLADRVQAHNRVKVLAQARVTAVEGELGEFELSVASDGKSATLRAGAVLLASGSGLVSPASQVAPGSARVVDMPGLVARLRACDIPARVALVADLTAEQGRAVSAQMLSAAELLTGRFGAEVRIFCRHVRVAAAGMESLYRRARQAGVTIVKFDQPPEIQAQGAAVAISVADPVAGARTTETFDLVAVADLRPSGNGGRRTRVAALKAGPDAALQYDDVWLLPSLTSRPGVFVAGAARSNSEYREALTDGLAAAQRIHALLGSQRVAWRDDAPIVDAEKCVLCLTCLRICPHGAIRIDEEQKAAAISPLACQRCGICTAECPARAISLPGFSDEQIGAQVGGGRRLTIFACENSALPAAQASGAGRQADLIRVPCAGKVDPCSVLSALENGADKVLIVGCHPESCRYLQGAGRAERRVRRIRAMLAKAGLDGSRVEFAGIAAVEPQRFVEMVEGRNDRRRAETD